MDRVLVKLSENGQTYKTMEEWQVKEPDCKPLTNTGNPLTLEKLISLFMIILSGILLALTVMIFELCSQCSTQNEVQLDNNDLLKFKKILEEIQNWLISRPGLEYNSKNLARSGQLSHSPLGSLLYLS